MGSTHDGRRRKADGASLFQLPWSKTEWAPLPRTPAAPTMPAKRAETTTGAAQTPSTVSAGTPTRRERQRAREARERVRRASENALAVGGIITDPEALYVIARRACFAKPAHDTDDTRGGVQAGLDAAEAASGGNMPVGRWFEERLIKEWNAGFTERRKREGKRETHAAPTVSMRGRAAMRVESAVMAALSTRGEVFTVPAKVVPSAWWRVSIAPSASGRPFVGITPPPPRKRRGVVTRVVITARILPAIGAGTAWGPGWLLLDIEPDGTRVVARQQGDRTFTHSREKPL